MPNRAQLIDRLLTNRLWGTLLFLTFSLFIFYCTFHLGTYPQAGIEWCIDQLASVITAHMNEGTLRDFVTTGIINGVGSVLVFLPNILILFFFIALFENTNYNQRAAKLMDRFMHHIGLHGASFMPLLMGLGCNVPAIMATRSIERKHDRILTVLIIPFMSCSARLPTYILLIGTFFPTSAMWVLMCLYLLGITVAIVTALVLKKTVLKAPLNDYEIELQPLKKPHLKEVLATMWDAGSEYLKKIGTVVLLAVMIIWALDYFPHDKKAIDQHRVEMGAIENNPLLTAEEKAAQADLAERQYLETVERNSYLGQIGHTIEPVLRPLGFDWKMSVSLLSGFPAKEFIISTMGVVYQADSDAESTTSLKARLQSETYDTGPRAGQKVFNKAVALSFLVFALLYFPCIPSVIAIRKESGKWSWAVFSILYTTGIAWLLAFAAYHIGLLIW